MPKIKAKYEKGQLPAGLAEFAVERDGFMFLEFDDDVALLTNPPLAAKNAELLSEKQAVQAKYDGLLVSSGDISKEVLELRSKIASGGQVSENELAILNALKGIDTTPDDVKKILSQFPALQEELNSLKSQAENDKIAKALGWKPEVFNDLRKHPDRKDLKFTVEPVTAEGKVTDKVYVEVKDAQGVVSKKEVSDFVKADPAWANFLPSLQVTQGQDQSWLPQSPADGDPVGGKSLVQQHIEARNAEAKAKGNAFVPPVPAPQPTA